MKIITTLLTASISTCVNAAAPAPILNTSFDCAEARAAVEKLICRDPQLKQMDIELTRLYRLALTDERSVPPPNTIMIEQQFWTATRTQCGADPDAKACAIRLYAERAYQLRQGSAIVRTKDPDRLTDGPLTIRCAGLNTPIAATFFNTQPGVLFLKWASTSITLSQVKSESGTRYTGKDSQGSYSFSQNGNSVLFQKPGAGAMNCRAEPII